MALASTRIASLTLAAIFNSATSALASTPRAPTARPSVSSRPPSASGLTLVDIRTPPNDSATSLPGSINTTGIALTPPSHRPQPKTTHLPFWSRWQQPLDTPHLAAEGVLSQGPCGAGAPPANKQEDVNPTTLSPCTNHPS